MKTSFNTKDNIKENYVPYIPVFFFNRPSGSWNSLCESWASCLARHVAVFTKGVPLHFRRSLASQAIREGGYQLRARILSLASNLQQMTRWQNCARQ